MSHYEALKRAEQELADAKEKFRLGQNNSGHSAQLKAAEISARWKLAQVTAEYQEHERKRLEFGNGY